MTVSIDFEKINDRIDTLIKRAGDKSAATALENIRRRAPVRKLFRGTTYQGQGVARRPVIRQLMVAGGPGAKLDPSRGFLEKIGDETNERADRVRGHANSIQPLLRRRMRGSTFTTVGDFRRVENGRLAKLEPGRDYNVYETRAGRTTKLDVDKLKTLDPEEIRVNGGRALTSRGRYEARMGRANYRAPGSSHTTVGGRLRGELHIEGPTRYLGIYRWYIVSRTKDKKTGRLYPRDQEFGTRHHPPHPFMRPGLHASRDALRNNVRTGLKEGLRKR